MDWATATRAARRGRSDAGGGPLPLAYLLTARAVDALEPSTLEVDDRGQFSHRGDVPVGDDTVLTALRVPGVKVLRTVSNAGGIPLGAEWPDVYSARFTAADAVAAVGPLLVRFVNALDGLWSKTSFQGFWSAEQIGRIRTAVACGVAVVPTSTGTKPPGWTPESATRYDNLVGRFAELGRLYMQGKQAEASLAGEQAARDTAFWNSVADVTGAAALQSVIDGDEADGNGSWLSRWWSGVLNLWSSWLGKALFLGIIVGAGWLLWKNREQVSGLVGRKIDAAGRKPAAKRKAAPKTKPAPAPAPAAA